MPFSFSDSQRQESSESGFPHVVRWPLTTLLELGSSAKSSADTSRKALEEVNPRTAVLQGICYHWSALPVLKECMRQGTVPDPHWLWWYIQSPFRTWSTGKGTHVVVGASWHFCTIGTDPELIRPAGLELSFFLLGFSLSWSPEHPGIPIWTIFPLVS